MVQESLGCRIQQSDFQYILVGHDGRQDVVKCVDAGRTMGTVPRQLQGARTLDGYLRGMARRPHVPGV